MLGRNFYAARPFVRGVRLIQVSIAALVALSMAAAPAGGSAASWSAPAAIGPGIVPLVGFGPTGEAAVVSNQFDPTGGAGGGGLAYVMLRPPGGGFGAPQVVSPPSYGYGEQPNVDGLALTSAGAVVLVFDSAAQEGELPVAAMVKPSGATDYGSAQQLVGPGEAEANTPTGIVAATTRGEAVFVGSDLGGDVSTATLAPGGSRFSAGPALSALSGTGVGPQLLAVDGAGGAFATAVGGCIPLAYRPPDGRFKTTYNYCAPGGFSATVDGLTATGNGYAAVADEIDHAHQNSMYVQIGRYGRLGPRHLLDTVPITNSSHVIGITADRTGGVTIAWTHCNVYGWNCGVFAADGTMTRGIGPAHAIAAGIRSPKINTTGWVADHGVAFLRCARGRPCTLSVSVAGRRGRFGVPQMIARGATPEQFLGDGRGDLLLVYRDHHDAIYAVSRPASSHHFSAPVRLAPPGTDTGTATDTTTVTGAFGPDREAIVAWSHAGKTYAAVYRV